MTNEELCILAKEGDKKAEDELFRRIRSSLIASAERFEHLYSGLNLEIDDLMQEASIGFLHAVRTFHPEKEILFSTYLMRISKNAMMDYVRKCAALVPPSGPILSLEASLKDDDSDSYDSLYDRLPSPYTKTPEQIFMEKETYEEMHRVLKTLSPRECTYLRYRYGFTDDYPHSRKETANHFSLSLNRTQSLEKDALNNACEIYRSLQLYNSIYNS